MAQLCTASDDNTVWMAETIMLAKKAGVSAVEKYEKLKHKMESKNLAMFEEEEDYDGEFEEDDPDEEDEDDDDVEDIQRGPRSRQPALMEESSSDDDSTEEDDVPPDPEIHISPPIKVLSSPATEKGAKLFNKLTDLFNDVVGMYTDRHDMFEAISSDYDATQIVSFDEKSERDLAPGVEPFDESDPSASARKISVIVALTDFEGELTFPGSKLEIKRLQAGDVLVFPSCCLHPYYMQAAHPAVFALGHVI